MSGTDVESNATSEINSPRFHGERGEYYALSWLRLRATCCVKGVWSFLATDTESTVATSTDAIITDTSVQAVICLAERE